jgi:hypothetical protein
MCWSFPRDEVRLPSLSSSVVVLSSCVMVLADDAHTTHDTRRSGAIPRPDASGGERPVDFRFELLRAHTARSSVLLLTRPLSLVCVAYRARAHTHTHTAQRIGDVVERHFKGDALTMAVQDGAAAGQTVSASFDTPLCPPLVQPLTPRGHRVHCALCCVQAMCTST